MRVMTREEYLTRAITVMRPWFAKAGAAIPDKIRVAVGFPSKRALSVKRRRVGECWCPSASKDGANEVFISPFLGNGVEALAVLVHELTHAAVGIHVGHKGAFRKTAVAVGLTGKMTATSPSPELMERLNALAAKIGDYPHAALDPTKGPIKKQTTRMVKAECEDCGYTIRTTRKWIEQGLPTCVCGGAFEVEEREG